MSNLLAKSFARALYEFKDLNSIALPSGILNEEEVLYELTRHANGLWSRSYNGMPEDDPDYVPFAVLFLKKLSNPPTDFDVCTVEGELASYRKGNRLFVGTAHEFATLIDAIPVTVGNNYPSGHGQYGSLPLKHLAKSILAEIQKELNLDPVRSDLGNLLTALTYLLSLLADAYEDAGTVTVDWNAVWFDHVNHALNQLLDGLKRMGSNLDFDSYVQDYLFASFSLPIPKAGFSEKYSKPHQAKSAINNALKLFWSNSNEVELSIAMLRNFPGFVGIPPDNNHPLSLIDWSRYDDTISSETVRSSAPLAWAIHESNANGRLLYFTELTEDQFFDPRRVSKGALKIIDPTDSNLVFQIDGSSLHIINGVSLSGNVGRFQSPEVHVVVPIKLGQSVTSSDVSGSSLRVVAKKGVFEGLLLRQSEIIFEGLFGVEVNGSSNNFKFVPKIDVVSLQIDPADSLIGKIEQSAKASYVFAPAGALGAFIFPILPSGKVESPKIICQTECVNGVWVPLETQELEVATSKNYQVVLFGDKPELQASLNGVAIQAVEGSQFLWLSEIFSASGLDRLVIGSLEVLLISENESTSAPESPIVAAIEKVAHARTVPKSQHRDSLRGELEDLYVNLLQEDLWEASLGHVILPSDQLGSINDIQPIASHPDFLMSPDMFSLWRNAGLLGVSSELRNSTEALAFRDSFVRLNLLKSLVRDFGDDGEQIVWVSKTSWEHLVDSPALLDDYLTCYQQLVQKAYELGDRMGRVWAAYPFSASVWQTKPVFKLQTVLLSPLHPIRLSWMAKMEHSLRRAVNATQFCGTVEGWNFPVLGPSNTASGKLIAVPCDIDSDQLFLGWSMMVDVSINGHGVLSAPPFAGSRSMPGISSAGLNANTVKDALKDFRRLHPHVSTLTVDLASRSLSPKLREMDDAVISEFSEWATSERTAQGLVGGVRVYDSLNREGPPPAFADESSSRQKSGPLTWNRYEDNPLRVIDANIRILQDSGISVEVTEEAVTTNGVIGRIPFRRYEIPINGAPIISGEVQYRPALSRRDQAGSFYDALRAIETPREIFPSIGLQIQGNSPLLGEAQWTISGESMISPAALAGILAANQGVSQMLWEWHPPFLSDATSSGVNSAIEKRSYFTLAKIPRLLQGKLKSKLTFLLGRDADDLDVKRVFNVLGTRGIGLSALVAAGGSQLTGSLGFYSVFVLDALTDSDKTNRFIMPIDACHQFLSSLMGVELDDRDKKRADLLVIGLTGDSICLTPIEIKFYGTTDNDNPAPNLPQCGSAPLADASSQAQSTFRMLEAIQKNWLKTRLEPASVNDHALKANALASFVEAAMRIHPGSVDIESATKGLQAVIDGSINIKLGRPVVAYFTPTSSETKVQVCLDVQTQSSSGHAEFICDPRAALQQVHSGKGNVIEEWKRVLDWAMCKKSEEEGTGEKSLSDEGAKAPEDIAANTVNEKEGESQVTPKSEVDTTEDVATVEIAQDPVVEEVELKESEDEVVESIETVEASIDTNLVPRITDSVVKSGQQIEAEGVKFSVGTLTNTSPAQSATFWPGNTALSQLNIGVVGNLGTGKTQLVKSLIRQLRDVSARVQPEPLTMLVLDYKHDYQDEQFLRAVGGKVLKPHNIPLDIFRIIGEDTQPNRFRRASAFVDVIKKIYGGVGPVQIDKLKTAIMTVYANSSATPTLNQVLEAYSAAVPNGDAVVAILNNFVMQEIFSSDVNELKTLSELIDGSVLVLDLRDLDPDQLTKNALVALFLNQYFEYMIQLTKWPFETRENIQLRRLNSYIVVDEATNIMEYGFDALSALLLQGREYGVGVLLSTQFLSHFVPSGGQDYGQPLLTWFIHQVPNARLADLRSIGFTGATAADASRISNLAVHHAMYKSLNYSGTYIRGLPFFELE